MSVSPGVGLQGMGEGIGDPGVAVTPQTLHTIECGIASVVTPPAPTYATWNPSDKGANVTLSNGNLTASFDTSDNAVRSTISKSSGKWYWELSFDSGTNADFGGIALSTAALTDYVGADANGYGWWASNGWVMNSGAPVATYSTLAAGDIIGIALDLDGGILTMYKNNTAQSATITGLSGTWFAAISRRGVAASITANFGATAFTYTPPTGFNAGL